MKNSKTILPGLIVVLLYFPGMVFCQPGNIDDFNVEYYNVEIEGVQFFAEAITLPEFTAQTIQSTGGRRTRIVPATNTNLFIKRALNRDRFFYDWFRENSTNSGASPKRIEIQLMNRAGEVVMTWIFMQAKPVKYKPVIKGSQATEILEFSFESWERND